MNEIDKITARVKALQEQSKPFIVATILPIGEGVHRVTYDVHNSKKTLEEGEQLFSAKEFAQDFINKKIEQYNIDDDKQHAVIININPIKPPDNGA